MTPIQTLVRHFGGQSKTAQALGVSQPAVSHWLAGTHRMSAASAFKAEELTGGLVSAKELCSPVPDESGPA
ncbi:transcriptional regulator [Pseudomonas urethralis]|uniref:transcriptional regulator n=1 Tax=Pseudomonas urethralis TaxID=2740517 RepID=UPI001596D4AF|nr:Cro/CI family transcriptional regulator [Pseudomonas urethralis]